MLIYLLHILLRKVEKNQQREFFKHKQLLFGKKFLKIYYKLNS